MPQWEGIYTGTGKGPWCDKFTAYAAYNMSTACCQDEHRAMKIGGAELEGPN